MERAAGAASVTSGEHYLHPGELHATSEPRVITTILGSCVSVCLFDEQGVTGGANHFLLATPPADNPKSPRYAPGAIEALVERMLGLGARRSRLAAKLFGGANVLHAFHDGARHIGAMNVEAARTELQAHRIRICAEDVGGIYGRKLRFASRGGEAWIRVLRP